VGYYDGFERYTQTTSGKIKQQSSEYIRKAAAKKITLHPVIIEGKKITKSWWGQSWCNNLERYADFESRLERGRKYIRAGAVVDLEIEEGMIYARVLGSRKTPYKIEIKIKPLAENKCGKLIAQCSDKIENVESLVSGTFPDSLKDVFFSKDGLFPSPEEIRFNCSCPDWADMCKHVAAALYGVGARFDEDALLFFKLRGLDVNSFIDTAISSKAEEMLSNAHCRTNRMIDDGDASRLFSFYTHSDTVV
jgi:uncharacterized Zn finger protein